MNKRIVASVFAAVSLCAPALLADEPAPAAPEPAPATPEAAPPKTDAGPTPAEKKAKYALPFAMRPAIAPNLVRLDASYAAFQSPSGPSVDFTVISSILTAGYKPIDSLPDLGFYGRAAFVKYKQDPDPASLSGSGFSNPLLFGMYTPEIAPKIRLPLFAGVALPIGSGGGNDPDLAKSTTIRSAPYARQAMDNALFASNYLTPTLGAGIAWIDQGFTVQAETTVLFLRRVKGDLADADSARTNFTAGLNVGYLVIPMLSLNAELHYQRWLSTPLAVEKDEAKPTDDQRGLRDQLTAGIGVRANLPLDKKTILRPGIAYFRGIDKPMGDQKYSIIQLDVPVAF